MSFLLHLFHLSPSTSRERKRDKMRRWASSPPSSLSSPLLHFMFSLAPLFFLSTTSEPVIFRDVSLENPAIELVLSPHAGYSCKRLQVTGISRLNLKSYASSLHVTINTSAAMSEKLRGKLEVCIHRNASIGLCQWENCEWRNLQNGQWTELISPYQTRYVDVKFKDKALVSVFVSVKEEFHRWRLFFLGIGFFLLLSAPIVSNWVPFYYSTSMALGVLLVVLLVLFQGMKLLPLGRKNALYLTLYGSLLGIGSYIVHYFSTVINSILVSFGLSEEMHNPVSIFLLVGVALAGAALGYWIVRKYVLSEDGSVDAGTAQFVKWGMRFIAMVFILLSSLDSLLALVAFFLCWSICFLITSKSWRSLPTLQYTNQKNKNLWQQRAQQASPSNKHAEFLLRPGNDIRGTIRGSPSSPYTRPNLQIKAPSSLPNKKSAWGDEDYYSSFHRTPIRRKFSKPQWEDFTRKSTKEALAEWAASPEVTNWLAENAHRMRLDAGHSSDDDDDGTGSSSGSSSEETAVENGNVLGLLKWY